jgi:AcrR family transcriptional regulator
MPEESTSTRNRQTRKRLATRQKISDIATRLFFERGFDRVKIEEIAEAADVSRMTVFNHFPRKEDMFFDLDGEGRADLLDSLQRKEPGMAPLEALRLFAHEAVRVQKPYVRFFDPHTDRFMATLEASEALKSRAGAIRDELTEVLAAALTVSARRPHPDPIARLSASLLIATWAVALTDAHRAFQRDRDVKKANTLFLELIDRGTRGTQTAIEGTPYA